MNDQHLHQYRAGYSISRAIARIAAQGHHELDDIVATLTTGDGWLDRHQLLRIVATLDQLPPDYAVMRAIFSDAAQQLETAAEPELVHQERRR